MSNRDFDARPKQAGGRTTQDYGNTKLSKRLGTAKAIAFGAVAGGLVYAALLYQLGGMPV